MTVWTGLASYLCGVLGVLVRAQVPHVAPTVLIALGAVSLLLYEIWKWLRLAHFRQALLYGSAAVVIMVIPIAFSLWRPGLHVGIALALSGLALVAIQGEMPRRELVYLALVAFCGVWLKVFDSALRFEVPTSSLWFGLALASYSLILLCVVEIIRARSSDVWDGSLFRQAVVDRSRARLFAALIPTFVIVASSLADAMAWMNLEAFRWSGLILLLAAVGLLWASRFMRESILVYAGLWHAIGAVSCLSRSLYAWHGEAQLVGWLAVTLALTALALWLASLVTRRRRFEDIYWVPCLNTALGLTGAVFVMAVNARVMAREAFELGSLALALDALACLLIATSRRWSWLIYATVVCFAAAGYMILLSSPRPDPKMAYVLGLYAVIQALVVWVSGDVCRRLAKPWPQECARPLFHSALILTVLAIPPAFQSPVTMSLVAVSFLLTVKSLQDAGWIYPSLAAIGAALYFPWLAHLALGEQITACLVGAYALWMLGLLVRRGKAFLAARLGLRPFDYELPFFNLAVAVGLGAFLLKFDGGLEHGTQWTGRPWVPLLLAPLALGMIRARPRSEFVHASLGFLIWGVVSVIAPSLSDPHFLALAVTAGALGLQVTDLAIRPGERSLCDRLGIQGVSFGAILRAWWYGLGAIGILLGSGVVMAGMAEALALAPELGLTTSPADWWAIMASIVLVGTQIILAGLDADLLAAMRPEGLIVGVELTVVALLWWLGAAGSPLGMWNLHPGRYYPLATALAGLVIAEWNSRLGQRENLAGAAERGRTFSAGVALLSSPVLVLALLAPVFTFGRENTTTVATLVFVAMALGLWSVRWEQVWAAYLAGLAWSAAGLAGGLVVGRQCNWIANEPRLMSAALGELVAVFTLGGLGGWFRQKSSSQEREQPGWTSRSSAFPRHLALAHEQVAFLASLCVAGLVVAAVATQTAGRTATVASGLALASTGTLLALSLFYILLTGRWKAEWLVYLAQACLVGAYVDYRLENPLEPAADAAVLVLFAFVDLGIAEVMERFQLPLYARPTRYASLILPVLPLIRLLEIGGLDDVTVFHLLAAGTFYAVACGTMQWRTLGYAAGVLYNAALWVLWGRMGWQLADHTQFYFVPVGLSAILFAESNRRDLGRQTVNAIRSAGLITTYLALAAPIWQFRSFGDWVALLLGSILGLFAGIGLRVQTFVWLGLVTFLADVLYELGRVSLDHALAKWAIMLSLGILLVFFVALNEKKQIVAAMRGCFDEVRTWE